MSSPNLSNKARTTLIKILDVLDKRVGADALPGMSRDEERGCKYVLEVYKTEVPHKTEHRQVVAFDAMDDEEFDRLCQNSLESLDE